MKYQHMKDKRHLWSTEIGQITSWWLLILTCKISFCWIDTLSTSKLMKQVHGSRIQIQTFIFVLYLWAMWGSQTYTCSRYWEVAGSLHSCLAKFSGTGHSYQPCCWGDTIALQRKALNNQTVAADNKQVINEEHTSVTDPTWGLSLKTRNHRRSGKSFSPCLWFTGISSRGPQVSTDISTNWVLRFEEISVQMVHRCKCTSNNLILIYCDDEVAITVSTICLFWFCFQWYLAIFLFGRRHR